MSSECPPAYLRARASRVLARRSSLEQRPPFFVPKPGERHGVRTSRVREHGPLRSVHMLGMTPEAWGLAAQDALAPQA
jgi:hypothetical protein